MKKIRYAVIGTGNIGMPHSRVVSELEEAELVAVVDTDLSKAEAAARLYSAKAYADLNAMLDECRPDAVSVCVPTSRHLEVGLACIKRGVHILMEKPIAATIEDGRLLIDEAKRRGVQLLVGHIERFNPAVNKVKEILDGGRMGKIVSLMARRVGVSPPRMRDSSIATDLAIHDIDIANYLFGRAPKKVASERHRTGSQDNSVEFFLSYDGASAFIQANWITPVKIRKLSITGTNGYLEMDYINQKIHFYKKDSEKYNNPSGRIDGFSDHVLKYIEPDLEDISVVKSEPLKEEIRHFLRMITGGKPFDVDYAMDALAIALQC